VLGRHTNKPADGLGRSSRCTFINQFLEQAFDNVLARHQLAGKKIGPMPNLVADPCTRALNIINKSYEGGQTTAQLHNLYFVNLLHKKMPKESKAAS
jgi:hypothetical protein